MEADGGAGGGEGEGRRSMSFEGQRALMITS